MRRYLPYLFFFSLLSIFIRVSAQSSVGFGDTIVHQSFGSGIANPDTTGLPSWEINMPFDGSNKVCPNDGNYTITNQTLSTCFSGHWKVTTDHTGDPNGYFLLVNGSLKGQYFFIDTVSGLCAGQAQYQFSAWLINMQTNTSSNPPNLTFLIEYTDINGNTIDTSFDQFIPFSKIDGWKPYAYTFNKPAGITSLVLKITDNANSGSGNDFGLDDITFCAAGPSISNLINGQPASAMSVCKESLLKLQTTLSDYTTYNPPVYQWQKSIDSGLTWNDLITKKDTLNGANTLNISFFPDTVGGFQYRMNVHQSGATTCGVTSSPFVINVFQAVKVTLADTTVCDSYTWNGKTFTTSGIDSFHTNTVGGAHCDSLTIQRLTIKHSSDTTIFDTACLSYKWPLSGLTYIQSGLYHYDLIGGNNVHCDLNVTLDLTIQTPPSAILGPSTDTLVNGEIITLTDNTNDGIWSHTSKSVTEIVSTSGNSASIKAKQSGLDTIIYANACPAVIYPIVVLPSAIFIPNLFSPNGDNHNDIFYVRGSAALYKAVELWVFSSWGGEVFHSKGQIDLPMYGWDGNYNGQAQPTGTYVYVAKLTEQNGNIITKKGSITLIR